MGNVVEFKRKQPVPDHTIQVLRCPECGSEEFMLARVCGVTEIQCAHCDLMADYGTIQWLLESAKGSEQ